MLKRAIFDSNNPLKLEAHLMDVDLYLDNIEAQARHLRNLDPNQLLIPVDLYKSNQERGVILDSLPGRRREEQERHSHVEGVLGGRMFQGPEPSWIRKKLGQTE